MTALSEINTKCKMCNGESRVYSGLEEWAVLEKGIIFWLCKKCGKKVKDFIEEK